jgi:hypothetical protein
MAFAAARLASSLITGPLGLAPALGAGFLTFVLVFVGGGALMPEDRERLRAGVKALQRPLDQRQSTPSA